MSVYDPVPLTRPSPLAARFRPVLEAQLLEHTRRLDALPAAGSDADPAELAQRAATTEAIRRVTAALARVENGSYGTCVACGAPIPEERLELVPHSDVCVTCARQGRAR